MKTSVFQVVATALVASVQTGQVSAGIRGIRGGADEPFQRFEGMACRTSIGEEGSNGQEFDLFWHVTRAQCADKCLESPFKCYGWEYSAQSGRCEVWKVFISDDTLDPVGGTECYIDKDELDAGDADVDSSEDFDTDFDAERIRGIRSFGDQPPLGFFDPLGMERGIRSSANFEKFEDRGCRTNSGYKGAAGDEYDLFNHVSKNFCKHKCNSFGSNCYGWEYSGEGKCEVWKVPINKNKLAHVHDLDCYIKY